MIPTPRRAAEHWCDECTDCAACSGRDRLPVRYRVVIRTSGEVVAVCTDCDGLGYRCPTLDTLEPA